MIKKNYKYFFLIVFIVTGYLFLSGCTQRISTVGLNFTVGNEYVTRGDTCWFKAKPNHHIRLDSIVTRLREFNYVYTVNNPSPGTIYYANQYFWVDWFTNVKTGQVWEFIFYGKYALRNEEFEERVYHIIR